MNKVSIEISMQGLAELLDYAKVGIQELGEVTPTCIEVFKTFLNNLPTTAWNYKELHKFVANLDNTIDGPDEDYSFILDDTNDYDDY